MTPDPIRIRPARLDDIAAMAPLIDALAAQHVAFDAGRFAPPAPADTIRVYGDWLREGMADGGRVAMLVAEDTEGLCGFVVLEHLPDEPTWWTRAHAYLHDIHVAPRVRGRGLGERLVEACKEWTRARGLTQLRGLVARDNANAQGFFAHHGWRTAALEMVVDVE